MSPAQFIVLVAFFAFGVLAQEPIYTQNNTWNSSYTLSADLAQAANLSEILLHNFEVAWNFERTNGAGGSVADDPFYNPPPVNASTPPGALLRVEEYTNTSYYTIPPGIGISRILYTSSTFNGTTVPASAYVLWPWKAKSFESSSYNTVSGVPLIGWAHGTSGVYGECAPSHMRNLWYHFTAPYEMAREGYAVVAPDYAGLGVDHTAEGEEIVHQVYANPTHADDLFYAIEAAQSAFPELTKQFVTVGHSQGGGAVWAGAERQVSKPVEGYLGTVSVAPGSDILEIIRADPASLFKITGRMAPGIKSVFPDFDPSELLLPDGVKRLNLLKKIQGCNSAESILWGTVDRSILVKPHWEENRYMHAYNNLTSTSRKPISGPMLVIQGTDDILVNPHVTSTLVNQTCAKFPDNQITQLTIEGAAHVPIMNVAQPDVFEWIKDRFSGVEVPNGCHWEYQKPLRKLETYENEPNFFLQWMVYSYGVP
jgi:pimeloyl-ACP methyl ester carboxylesterase